MTASGKITQAEMIEMFGTQMPVEAVNLLFYSPGEMTLGEMRAKLRGIAAERRKHPVLGRMSPVRHSTQSEGAKGLDD